MKLKLFMAIATIAVVLLPLFSKSQEAFLGDKRQLISDTMDDAKYKYTKSDYTDDKKYLFDIYEYENGTLVFYFNSKNICQIVTHILSNKFLIPAIKDLNDRYKKLEDDIWINPKLNIKVKLTLNDKRFSITYYVIE